MHFIRGSHVHDTDDTLSVPGLPLPEAGRRLGSQCRERWEYQLNPEINKSEFTSEEDAYLLALPQPGDWKNVVKKLPGPGGRTDMAVKTRYHTLMKRKRAPKKRKRKR